MEMTTATRPILTGDEARILEAYVKGVQIADIGRRLGLDHAFVASVICHRARVHRPAARQLLAVAEIIATPTFRRPRAKPADPRVRQRRQVRKPATDILSPGEVEVLGLLVDGLTDEEIAAYLIISAAAVGSRLKYAYLKLGVRTRDQAALAAIRTGAVPSFTPSRPAVPLNDRELLVLRMTAAGINQSGISSQTGLSLSQIKSSLRSTLHKLGASSRTRALVVAHRLGLIDGGTDV